MEYRTVWVKQWVLASDDTVQCTEVDRLVQAWVNDGWVLHSLVPGTNAQTFTGLFITFQRHI